MSSDSASLSRTGGRAVNEDYADSVHTTDASCWVLADGLGGHRGGEVASKIVVDAALRAFEAQPGVAADDVRRLVGEAQTALLEEQRRDPSLSQMRSTIVVLLANAREAVWGHVGDSRLYHIQGGLLATRTRDHSVSQALVDGGQIDADEQGAHEDRSRLLRSLGKEGEPGATIGGCTTLCRDDAFLLCTDGFWESLDEVALTLDYAGAEDAKSWLERLEARLRRRSDTGGGAGANASAGAGAIKDNYTAIGVRLLNPHAPVCPPHDPRVNASESRDRAAGAAGAAAATGPTSPWARGSRKRSEEGDRAGRSWLSWSQPWMLAAGAAIVLALIGAGLWQRHAISNWLGARATATPPTTAGPSAATPSATTPSATATDATKPATASDSAASGASPAPAVAVAEPSTASGAARDAKAVAESKASAGGGKTGSPVDHASADAVPPADASGGATHPPSADGSTSPSALPPPSTATPRLPADSASTPGSTSAAAGKFSGPAALPENTVFRPAKGLRYASLQEALRAAGANETIWIGPGKFTETLDPITRPLTLKGAGRSRSHIVLQGRRGFVITAASGSLDALDLCCATGEAVLELGGAFKGTIVHSRLRGGKGWGLVVKDAAKPSVIDTVIEKNGKGRISVRDKATLTEH